MNNKVDKFLKEACPGLQKSYTNKKFVKQYFDHLDKDVVDRDAVYRLWNQILDNSKDKETTEFLLEFFKTNDKMNQFAKKVLLKIKKRKRRRV